MGLRLSSKRCERIMEQRRRALVRRVKKRFATHRSKKHFLMFDQAIHLFDPIYARNMENNGGKWIVAVDISVRKK